MFPQRSGVPCGCWNPRRWRVPSLITAHASASGAHVPAAQRRAAQTVPRAEVFAPVQMVVRRAMRSRMPTELAAASAHTSWHHRGRECKAWCASWWTAKPAPTGRESRRRRAGAMPEDGAAVEGERGEGDDERGAARRREDDSESKLVEEVKRRLR